MNPGRRRFGALSSSVDPSQLGLSIQAGAKLVLGLLVTFGILVQSDVNAVLGQIPAAVAAGYSVWQFLELGFGLFRKLIAWFYRSAA